MGQKSWLKKMMSCLIAILMVIGNIGFNPIIAASDAYTIFVGTDRHQSTTGLQSTVTTAQSYVSSQYGTDISKTVHGGDLMNNTNSSSLSVVNAEFTDVLPSLAQDGSDCYYTYGHSHDSNVTTDGPNAFLSSAGCSGQTSPTRDEGVVTFGDDAYLWGIDYFEMSDASNAAKAAEIFTDWVDSLDNDDHRVIIIMSHMPMHTRRGDNNGASIWLKAINEVAQTKDIYFFWGHNHTGWSSADTAASYVAPGGSITAQGDSEATEIHFTYALAGFLGQTAASWRGSTVTIMDDEVVLDQYTTSAHYAEHNQPRIDDGIHIVVKFKADDIIAQANEDGTIDAQTITKTLKVNKQELTDGVSYTYEMSDESGIIESISDEGLIQFTGQIGEADVTINAIYTYSDLQQRASTTIHVTTKKYSNILKELFDYVDEAETDQSYVIVSNNHALVNDNGKIKAVEVSEEDELVKILDGTYDVDQVLWTVGSDGSLINDGYYVYRSSGNKEASLTLNTSTSTKYSNWTYTGDQLTVVGGQSSNTTYYIYYNDGWYTNTSTSYTTKLYEHIDEIINHEVTFNSNGGSDVATQTVRHKKYVKEPDAPTREGYDFDGWYVDEECTEAFDFSTRVTDDLTLYAKWNCQHVFKESWNWSEDLSSATLTLNCQRCGEVHTLEASITSETKAATCTSAGMMTYTASTQNDDVNYTDTKEVTIPALGHDYGDPIYTWSEDNAQVTAEVVCQNDSTHIITEKVNTTNEVTQDATCEAKGTMTYTATFTNEMFKKQTKTVNIDALGHDWSEPVWTWNDDYTATATFTCQNDENHTTVIDVTDITKEEVAATPEEDGSVTYTANVQGPDGKIYEDVKIEVISATGYTYKEPEYEWVKQDDGYECIATMICNEDEDKNIVESVKSSYEVTKEPTCEEAGSGTYTAAFNNKSFMTQTKTVDIEAIGHDWSGPSWTWANDYSQATGTFICLNDSHHEKEVSTNDITVEKVDATPTENGSMTYKASIKGPDSKTYEDVRSEIIPATGYSYQEPTYQWNETEDGYSVTATKVCNEDEAQNIIETVNASFEITKEATCEEEGSITYTAVFATEDFKKQTKTVKIDALGHDWNEPVWSWQDDYSQATATFTCQNDSNHIEEVTVTKIEVEEVEATPIQEGSKTYTAEVTGPDGKNYKDSKEIVVPYSGGYTYQDPDYQWNQTDDGYKVTAIKTCNEDDSKSIKETVTADYSVTQKATCEEQGTGVYKAVFTNEAFETQIKTVAIDALGHNYGEPVYTWSDDNKEVRATVVCQNDDSHVLTETVATTFEVISPATDEQDGETSYKAVFENDIFETQTKTQTTDAFDDSYITSATGDVSGSKFNPLRLREKYSSKTSISLQWNTVVGATSYVLYGNSCVSENKFIKMATLDSSTTTYKVTEVNGTSLKKATFYKFVVVALKQNNDGTIEAITTAKTAHIITKYGKKANYTKVTLKKKKATIKKGKTYKIKATQKKAKGTKVSKHRKLCFESGDPTIATVSSSGKIKGKKKGKATIYVYMQNGKYATFTITVK